MNKERLDKYLVDLGYFETKSKAAAAILAGHVKVNDEYITKAGFQMNPSKEYDIQVTDIDTSSSEINKGLVIQVTDPELLEKTGGIIQGMSGSPIIQNGKLIGAVTHVFVQDSTKGYGIFIENMMNQVETSEPSKIMSN